MADTSLKKDRQKKKAKAKQDKADKMAERKANNNKGKSLEDMMVYLDENGNLSDTPPDPRRKKTINAEDISLDNKRPVEELVIEDKKGIITFYNESKGYGFITDMKTKVNVFFHVNQLLEPVKENNVVIYETERTPRGLSAVRVRKEKK
jgi:cold shock CspA family protein